MRFIIVLAVAIGLVSAQCSTQRDGCCLKESTTECDTCHWGDEPFPCNCKCLERGLCPCTEYDNDAHKCLSWYSPDGHVSLPS